MPKIRLKMKAFISSRWQSNALLVVALILGLYKGCWLSNSLCNQNQDTIYTDNFLGTVDNVFNSIDCHSICLENKICASWVFNSLAHTCTLKSKTFSGGNLMRRRRSSVDANQTASVRNGFIFDCTGDIDYDYLGSDLKYEIVKDAGECCALCNQIGECNAWTYVVVTRVCWLKRDPHCSVRSTGRMEILCSN